MNIFQIIALLTWVAFLIYWGLNWKKVKPSKQVKSEFWRFRIIGIFTIALIIIVTRVFKLVPPCEITWTGCHIYKASQFEFTILDYVGTLLSLTGVMIAIVARRTLSTNWSSTLDLKEGHELITKGVYSKVRHPIYTGLMLMMIGTMFVFPTVLEIGIFIAVFVVVAIRIRNEEELMIKTFPKEYPAYKKRTKMLIPFIF